jgi:hypothetical protein
MRRYPQTYAPRTRPRLEQLEDRSQPAVFRLGAVLQPVVEPVGFAVASVARSHEDTTPQAPDAVALATSETSTTPVVVLVLRFQFQRLSVSFTDLLDRPTGDRPDPSPVVVPSSAGEESPAVTFLIGGVADSPVVFPAPTTLDQGADSGSDGPAGPVAADDAPASAPNAPASGPAVADQPTGPTAPRAAEATPARAGSAAPATEAVVAAPVQLAPGLFTPVSAVTSDAGRSPPVGQVPVGGGVVSGFARAPELPGFPPAFYSLPAAVSVEVAPAPRVVGPTGAPAAPVEVAPPPHLPAEDQPAPAADEVPTVLAVPVAPGQEEEAASDQAWIATTVALVAAGGYWVARRYRLVRRAVTALRALTNRPVPAG